MEYAVVPREHFIVSKTTISSPKTVHNWCSQMSKRRSLSSVHLHGCTCPLPSTAAVKGPAGEKPSGLRDGKVSSPAIGDLITGTGEAGGCMLRAPLATLPNVTSMMENGCVGAP